MKSCAAQHTHVGLFCPIVAASQALPQETCGFLYLLFTPFHFVPCCPLQFPSFYSNFSFFKFPSDAFISCFLVDSLLLICQYMLWSNISFCCCFAFADVRAERTLGNVVLLSASQLTNTIGYSLKALWVMYQGVCPCTTQGC